MTIRCFIVIVIWPFVICCLLDDVSKLWSFIVLNYNFSFRATHKNSKNCWFCFRLLHYTYLIFLSVTGFLTVSIVSPHSQSSNSGELNLLNISHIFLRNLWTTVVAFWLDIEFTQISSSSYSYTKQNCGLSD